MAQNPAGAVEASVDVFGSWVTEMAPSNLPAGVSPDNQDVAFLPGSVGARPALQKVFNSPFPAGGPSNLVPTVVYGKSFVLPDGTIKNLYMDSNGVLWVENFSTIPGVVTQLLASTPGSYCKSVTCFGREYIAISDGLHGSEIPLQYDGTNLDRVTQDGPAAPPSVIGLTIPPTTMAASGAPAALVVVSSISAGPTAPGHDIDPFWTLIKVTVTSGALAYNVNDLVVLAGSSAPNLDVSGSVTSIVSDTVFYISQYSDTLYSGAGGTATLGSGAGTTAARSGNLVTIVTTAAHKLQVGYQVQIGGLPAATVGTSISSIVVNNEDLPGIATVTTSAAHGLVPGCFVTLNGVGGVAVGGGISATSRKSGNVTITTASAHGITPGASVTIAGVTDTSFNGTWIVEQVPSTTTFVFTLVNSTDATSSAGTVSLNWPILSTALPTYFEVIQAPSSTKFQVQLSYCDGTWASGTVKFGWDGTFYVSAVLSTTSFQYQQYGPDATTSTAGTVTPYGQVSPGKHQLRLSFLTRQGYLTKPSPAVTFEANGGQYLSISDLAIGPTNVVARVLEFTGALGSYFFYIPVPAQINGQTVSTATQVSDNTTTSVVLDFSDVTLYSALGTSIPGNNTPNQLILDGALGFKSYAGRLLTWGQRNRIQNLLNMSFDGGYAPSAPTLPLGWTAADAAGALAPGHYGDGWLITVPNTNAASGQLSQTAYLDSYGAPIVKGNTNYRVRYWFEPSVVTANLSFKVILSSTSGSFTSTATFSGANMKTTGGWLEANFDTKTPDTVPADMTLTIYAKSNGTALTLLVDEGSLIYADQPYLESVIYGSYIANPEAFDGVTGKFGAADDSNKIMDMGTIRSVLNFLTREPSGRLHETSDNGVTEPSGWSINEVAQNCGLLSAFALTTSQADDNSAAGGEEWMAWASESGARIYGGSEPWKISQEIQPNWFDPTTAAQWVADNSQINMAAALSTWVVNDLLTRTIYFGVPIGTATAPNLIYPMNYREMETAEQIHNSPPFHPSLGGKLISTDNTRKWTRWNLAINGASRMYRTNSEELSMVLFAGNGQAPGAAVGFGNIYTMNPAKYTDDDYGQIFDYYISAALPTSTQEEVLQLDAGRKLLAYFAADVSGVGNVTITAYCNSLQNPWALTCTRTLVENPNFDLEWGGGSVQAQRIFFKVQSTPITDPLASGYTNGTDSAFYLQKLIPWFRKARILVRGAAQ